MMICLTVISDWCSRWGMLVNPSKTRGMFISRPRTVEPLFPDLVVDGTVVEMVSLLKYLGIILDSKLAFEKQVRAIAASASKRAGILRKTMSVFFEMSPLLPNAFGHLYSLCQSAVLQFGCLQPLPTCRCPS